MTMKEKIIYIGELDADVDDVIAAEYLHKNGVLKAVVLDPEPKIPKGLERKKRIGGIRRHSVDKDAACRRICVCRWGTHQSGQVFGNP